MATSVPEKLCGQTQPEAEPGQDAAADAGRQPGELDDAALDQIAAGKGSKGTPFGDPLSPPL